MLLSRRTHLLLLSLSGLMLVLMLVAPGALTPARAQGNLLQNPGFDGAYTGRGSISGGVPDGWNAWGSFQNSDHENLGVLVRSAPYSWRLRARSALPTGGGYQTVAAQRGTTYRFSIYAMIWTCDDEQWQCRDSTHTFSDTSSGGRVRIGIDPNGGTDPYSTGVRWSAFASPFDWGSFAGLSVDAAASASQITVFTYYTADKAMRFDDVFWDDATLVAVGSSGSTGSQNPPVPQATAVPVVQNAQSRPDGSQVHIVQPGQTLWAISQAYGVPLDTLRALNGINGSTIYVGQAIIVRAAPATAAPLATLAPAVVLVTATPPPTLVAQVPLITPVSVPVQANNSPQPAQDNGGSGSRAVVLAAAVVIVLGAVAVTGGLAGYLAYKLFRT
jgi:LysM repeat protein